MTCYYYQPEKLLQQFRLFKAFLEDKSQASCVASNNGTNSQSAKKRAGPSYVVAAVQFTSSRLPSSDIAGFWNVVEESIQVAAEVNGANLILVPELFLGPYFCQSQEACFMEMAWDNVQSCSLVKLMQELAKKYNVVLPVSLYERENNALYNTVVMVDADGTVLGKYRKSHIPDGVGYEEKYYFSPGDTGFKVWDTMVGKVGVAICWDQWFPEVARSMTLQGAEVLLYPTAIGSEPNNPSLDSADHWQRTMQGHAAANVSVSELLRHR
jgi:N-carbamoylputrescine amidase